jgi:tRNA(Ile)-lysidine synthase
MDTACHTTEKKVLELVRCQGLVSGVSRVVVGVSGGADSVCLLHILHKYQSALGIELHVAHLNHGLRGGDADADAEFVRALAERLGLEATIEKRDVAGYRARHGLTLEEAAREVRYRFLAETAGGDTVAVAHTRNDHVETVMLHLLRGAGLSGLVGLKETSTLSHKRITSLKIIRPLICLTRAEVEAYCRASGLEYRDDATNESLTPTRNRIRLQLLPEIRRQYNPRVDEALERLSRLAGDDADFIELRAAEAADLVVRTEGELTVIDRAGLAGLHPALRRAVLRAALAGALGSAKDIEAGHVEDMLDIATGGAGRMIDLPQGLVFRAGYGQAYLGKVSASLPGTSPVIEGRYRLTVPGETLLPGWRVIAELLPRSAVGEFPSTDDGLTAVMDAECAGRELTVRGRQDGDRFHPLGLGAEKKLKDFFIDARVPRDFRPGIPVVEGRGHIVWVAGYRLDERVRVTERTSEVLRLVFQPDSG